MMRLSRRQALRRAPVTFMSGTVAACALAEPARTPTQASGAPSGTPTPAGRVPRASSPSVAVTPNHDFYTTAITQRSDWLKPECYTLSIIGAVERTLMLTLSDLQALPAVEQMRTLECIGNPVGGDLIGNAVGRASACATCSTKPASGQPLSSSSRVAPMATGRQSHLPWPCSPTRCWPTR
jgi:hypothetical protein